MSYRDRIAEASAKRRQNMPVTSRINYVASWFVAVLFLVFAVVLAVRGARIGPVLLLVACSVMAFGSIYMHRLGARR